MEYEWEAKARKALDKRRADLKGGKFYITGSVVWNPQTGEGALIPHGIGPLQVVEAADVWKDAYGDAEDIYLEAVLGLACRDGA